MVKKKNYIGFIILTLAAALFISLPAQAVDFKISGQINRAALYADDGDTAKWFFVDNDNSSTRFRFTGSNDFEHDWKVGIVWEVEMQSDPSNRVNMGDDGSDFGDVHFDERKMEFWVEKWGRMWLGQGDTASNSTSEVDLSGTTVASYSDINAIGGSFQFKDNGTEIGVSVSDSRSNLYMIAQGEWGGGSATNTSVVMPALMLFYSEDAGVTWTGNVLASGITDTGTNEDWSLHKFKMSPNCDVLMFTPSGLSAASCNFMDITTGLVLPISPRKKIVADAP